MTLRPQSGNTDVAGFTLVELLVSTAIIALLMLVLVGMTNQMSSTWRYTTEKIEKFQQARDGFEAMTRQMAQATLNTYWDYFNSAGQQRTALNAPTFIPATYGRQSDLRFISGPMSILAPPSTSRPMHGVFFQAPFGAVEDAPTYGRMDNLLNTWGYFIEVSDDAADRPGILGARVPLRWRSRLKEFRQPSERMTVYNTNPATPNTDWFTTALASAPPPTRVLAENIVALIIVPKLSQEEEVIRLGKGWSALSPNYIYNSATTTTVAGYNAKQTPVNPGVTTVNGADPTDGAAINPKNQLPAILQVIMIAIDERSAARWVQRPGNSAKVPFGPALGTLFTLNSRNLEVPVSGDLATYERLLVAEGLTYRVFNTNVLIRGAKWSRAQTN